MDSNNEKLIKEIEAIDLGLVYLARPKDVTASQLVGLPRMVRVKRKGLLKLQDEINLEQRALQVEKEKMGLKLEILRQKQQKLKKSEDNVRVDLLAVKKCEGEVNRICHNILVISSYGVKSEESIRELEVGLRDLMKARADLAEAQKKTRYLLDKLKRITAQFVIIETGKYKLRQKLQMRFEQLRDKRLCLEGKRRCLMYILQDRRNTLLEHWKNQSKSLEHGFNPR